MNHWSLVYEGFDPENEGVREALCTLGNGYFATRGAAAENEADETHYPGTYAAGLYNRLHSEVAGRVVENEDLVNLPNWLALAFRLEGGNWFNPRALELLSYRQELDMRRGVLLRTVRFQDKQGRITRMSHRRLVHMRHPHLAALETRLVAENWSGRVEVRSALDGQVVNAGVKRYQGLANKHLVPLESAATDDLLYLKVQTSQSEVRIAQAARTRVFRDGTPLNAERTRIEQPSYAAHQFTIDLEQKRELVLEKVATLFTSRDVAISEPGLEARKWLERCGSFDKLLAEHVLAWEHLWNRFDIEIESARPNGDHRTAMILHLHLFHLLQTTSMHTMDLDAGVPARGWHGEAYRGHIFWDELFIFPLLNLRVPQITRSLLMHRYWRLNEARAAARAEGYRGAMYPWQSGSDGREETQQLHLNPRSGRWLPDNSHRQRHVNAAIAYNIWHYHQVTRDIEFLSMYGAETFLDIARFWSSLATFNPDQDRYEIHGVMGPDEYHDNYPGAETGGLNNNSYTNVMAAWVLSRALEMLDLLPADRRQELWDALSLSRDEIERWRLISRKMKIVFHADGIISQFEGYEQLEEFDWEQYRARYGTVARLDRILEAEGDTPNRYKASKQADVLMLFYLFSSEELAKLFRQLGYPFDPETIPKNIDYYLRRTSHGSTLSGVVHSWVLARADRTRSWHLFRDALEADISDVQGGTTAEGIHLGAMAGTVDLVQRAHTGIVTEGDVLWVNPCLPDEWSGLRIRLRYREHSLDLEIGKDTVTIRSVPGPAPPIRVGYKEVRELRPGETVRFALVGAGCADD